MREALIYWSIALFCLVAMIGAPAAAIVAFFTGDWRWLVWTFLGAFISWSLLKNV